MQPLFSPLQQETGNERTGYTTSYGPGASYLHLPLAPSANADAFAVDDLLTKMSNSQAFRPNLSAVILPAAPRSATASP